MDRAISVNRDLETQFPQVASACRFASSDSGLGVGADWSGGHFRTLSLQSLEGPKKPHIKKNIPQFRYATQTAIPRDPLRGENEGKTGSLGTHPIHFGTLPRGGERKKQTSIDLFLRNP